MTKIPRDLITWYIITCWKWISITFKLISPSLWLPFRHMLFIIHISWCSKSDFLTDCLHSDVPNLARCGDINKKKTHTQTTGSSSGIEVGRPPIRRSLLRHAVWKRVLLIVKNNPRKNLAKNIYFRTNRECNFLFKQTIFQPRFWWNGGGGTMGPENQFR